MPAAPAGGSARLIDHEARAKRHSIGAFIGQRQTQLFIPFFHEFLHQTLAGRSVIKNTTSLEAVRQK